MAETQKLNIDKNYLYDILGCDELSSNEQILTEYKIRIKKLHPDKNNGDTAATEKFVRLTKAKEILCDKDKRKQYDKWRKIDLEISFETWLKQTENSMCFHWAPKSRKKEMIGSGEKDIVDVGHNGDDNFKPSSPKMWERKTAWADTQLDKFRKHAI